MVDELTLLRVHRPATNGPDPLVTEQAISDFSDFLQSQKPRAVPHRSKPSTRRWLVIITAVAVLLLAAGIAIGVFGDGVVYTEAPTEITTVDDLTLIVQESNIGTCVEVRSTDGRMAGGCGGVDFDQPLSIQQGVISGTRYLSGWTSPATAEIVVTFPNGEQLSITGFVQADGYPVQFFLATDTPSESGLTATAFDNSGNELGSVKFKTP